MGGRNAQARRASPFDRAGRSRGCSCVGGADGDAIGGCVAARSFDRRIPKTSEQSDLDGFCPVSATRLLTGRAPGCTGHHGLPTPHPECFAVTGQRPGARRRSIVDTRARRGTACAVIVPRDGVAAARHGRSQPRLAWRSRDSTIASSKAELLARGARRLWQQQVVSVSPRAAGRRGTSAIDCITALQALLPALRQSRAAQPSATSYPSTREYAGAERVGRPAIYRQHRRRGPR